MALLKGELAAKLTERLKPKRLIILNLTRLSVRCFYPERKPFYYAKLLFLYPLNLSHDNFLPKSHFALCGGRPVFLKNAPNGSALGVLDQKTSNSPAAAVLFYNSMTSFYHFSALLYITLSLKCSSMFSS